MKAIIYTDSNGYLRRSLIRDDDPDTMAECGIPAGPPDIRQLDIDAILQSINNFLVQNNLFDWDDVQRSPGGVAPALNILKRAMIALYRDAEEKK
jgi:hypothetical protein